ncbi:PAAR domain-containing protein [Massilia sp. S19_KUP03_FR1]|uniref:PAAR domain-containing protein n=1 Tax=Massilia sp. S19_KUP03_FR1 TaxID=3025503 RepID=UPI002FCDD871
MANVIRLGDPTSHGGLVVDCCATSVKAGGKPMAVVGDKVICPVRGHTNCTIATGNARHRIDGKAVAYEGDTTSCGAVLQSTYSCFSIS